MWQKCNKKRKCLPLFLSEVRFPQHVEIGDVHMESLSRRSRHLYRAQKKK